MKRMTTSSSVSWLNSVPFRRLVLGGTAISLLLVAIASVLWTWRACIFPIGVSGAVDSVVPGTLSTPQKPYVGLTYVPITAQMAAYYKLAADSGILVTAVAPGGPAQKAGIEPDDIIVEFAGQNLGGEVTVLEILNQRMAGQVVEIVMVRGEEQRELTVTLASPP